MTVSAPRPESTRSVYEAEYMTLKRTKHESTRSVYETEFTALKTERVSVRIRSLGDILKWLAK